MERLYGNKPWRMVRDARTRAANLRIGKLRVAMSNPYRRDAPDNAVSSGQISRAGFDVASEEPLPATHPFQAILAHPGFILTPHVAWASDEATQALADQLIDNIAGFYAGQPRHIVEPH